MTTQTPPMVTPEICFAFLLHSFPVGTVKVDNFLRTSFENELRDELDALRDWHIIMANSVRLETPCAWWRVDVHRSGSVTFHSIGGQYSLGPASFFGQISMDIDVDLGDLVDLEQQFYEEGFKDGTQHGRLHGLIEGRALGKERGFEMWEEVGFYLGFATAWRALLQMQSDPNSKVISHLSHLLELVSSFPTRNPSTTLQEEMKDTLGGQEVDISGLLSRMRARYRVICSSLGVRPRLTSSNLIGAPLSQEEVPSHDTEFTSERVLHSSNPPVWSFADASKKAGVGGMAF